jgi:CheY-like chemotaxis protein
MPEMDGYEATGIIKSDGSINSNTPVIAMTANAFGSDREKCLSAGMDDFITKPVNRRKFEECVTRHLSA